MTTKIFDAALTDATLPGPTGFLATTPLLMVGSDAHVSLDFLFTIAGGATGVVWYLEFTEDDPNAAATVWAREIAEEDGGGGVVDMPVVVRRFRAHGAVIADLPNGEHNLSAQFLRKHKYFRVQVGIITGGGGVARMQIFAQFGLAANTPVT